MPQHSAGLLLYRRGPIGLSVLLIHPGGPFWRNRDAGAWQIPKGGIEPGEDALSAARREVAEELGRAFDCDMLALGELRQAGGKRVEAFACEADFDPGTIVSNLFEMEWPPRSGERQSFPEVDEARWFSLPQARAMMLTSQLPFLDRLETAIAG